MFDPVESGCVTGVKPPLPPVVTIAPPVAPSLCNDCDEDYLPDPEDEPVELDEYDARTETQEVSAVNMKTLAKEVHNMRKDVAHLEARISTLPSMVQAIDSSVNVIRSLLMSTKLNICMESGKPFDECVQEVPMGKSELFSELLPSLLETSTQISNDTADQSATTTESSVTDDSNSTTSASPTTAISESADNSTQSTEDSPRYHQPKGILDFFGMGQSSADTADSSGASAQPSDIVDASEMMRFINTLNRMAKFAEQANNTRKRFVNTKKLSKLFRHKVLHPLF